MSEMTPTPHRPPWDAVADYICVALRDVEVEAHVGLHPWERHPERPSRLLVTVEMFAHLAAGRIADGAKPVIDYDRVRDGLRGWSSRAHTLLLETLAEEVISLCLADAAVEACRVSIVKPDIFNEAAGAGVEIYRVRPRSR
jgi:7,8-dihydroneopterin aldolase/epimerase/oxygenase